MFNIVGGNDLTLQEVGRLHINSAALDLKSFSRHTIPGAHQVDSKYFKLNLSSSLYHLNRPSSPLLHLDFI